MTETVNSHQRVDPRTIKPAPFNLKTQLLSGGMTRSQLIGGEFSTMHVLCYASGLGEDHGIHAHPDEEHGFIVLSGCAQFKTLNGELPLLQKSDGLFLPRGCFYEFVNPADEPLVILRFGASSSQELLEGKRLDPKGQPIQGRDYLVPVPIEGSFFE